MMVGWKSAEDIVEGPWRVVAAQGVIGGAVIGEGVVGGAKASQGVIGGAVIGEGRGD